MYSADYPETDSSYNANGYFAAALLVREWPREPFSTPLVFPLSLVKSGTLPFLLGGNFVAIRARRWSTKGPLGPRKLVNKRAAS
jgi:hypothetical protein